MSGLRPRRRRRIDATVVLLGVAVLGLLTLLALPAGDGETRLTFGGGVAPQQRTLASALPVLPRPSAPIPEASRAHDGWAASMVAAWEQRDVAPGLARIGRLELSSPVLDPVVVGFHEATNNHALPLYPVGPLVRDDNPTRSAPVSISRDDAAAYLVLASRGRSAPPTTAVDVIAHLDAPVIAPVTGEVTDVRSFTLYGEHADQRVEIRPIDDPSLRVVLIHVGGVTVAPGDHVVGGSSIVAERATLFPFRSQIDRETEPRFLPHVHIEVQPFDAPRPGDPPPGHADADPEGR